MYVNECFKANKKTMMISCSPKDWLPSFDGRKGRFLTKYIKYTHRLTSWLPLFDGRKGRNRNKKSPRITAQAFTKGG
jgi:hypothetical protein